MKKIFLTKSGLLELQQEYRQLSGKRVGAVANLKTAREMGDLSENAAYKVARSKLSSVDSRLRYLERILRYAEIKEKPKDGEIGIGSKVKLEIDGETVDYEIVSSVESDLDNRKLSASSPVGRNLIGRKIDDEVRIITPQGQKIYQIVSVS